MDFGKHHVGQTSKYVQKGDLSSAQTKSQPTDNEGPTDSQGPTTSTSTPPVIITITIIIIVFLKTMSSGWRKFSYPKGKGRVPLSMCTETEEEAQRRVI